MRGVTILDIEFLTIGDNTTIGGSCLLDSRAGLYIGNNVTSQATCSSSAAATTSTIRTSCRSRIPTVVQDYVWIASRAMVLPSLIRRGAVVAAGRW